MSRILLLGLVPETVDYSDPTLPPGMTAEKVHAGIAVALKQFTDRGWESDVGYIRPDETAGPTVESQLRSTRYDCLVIGAGVRLPPRNLALLKSLSILLVSSITPRFHRGGSGQNFSCLSRTNTLTVSRLTPSAFIASAVV